MENITKLSAAIGHNNPPTDAEIFEQRMQEKHPDLLRRIQALLIQAADAPKEVATDDEAAPLMDIVKAITAASKDADAIRADEKEPYLTMGRVVDGFFKARAIDPLSRAKTNVNSILTAFLSRKQAEERARLAEEARKAREKAEAEAKLAAELEAANMRQASDAVMGQAVATEAAAVRLEVKSEAKPAELSRTQGSIGTTASLRTRWVGEVIDRAALDLESLRQHLPADALQKALNSFVQAGGRELRGARIFEQSDAVVR